LGTCYYLKNININNNIIIVGTDNINLQGKPPYVATHPVPSKAGGTVTARENPRGYYQPDIIRCWKLDRGRSATYHRSSGIEPAHQSMINRRCMIMPPALPSSSHAG
jgi:hypothetical protein